MSLKPSFTPVMGSATSRAEQVPWPLLLTFTLTSKDPALNLRVCGLSFRCTCTVGSHSWPVGLTSAKIAIETVDSVPGLIVFGNEKLGLMSIRCTPGVDDPVEGPQ